MNRSARLFWVATPALIVAGRLPASAAVYLSADDAAHELFPGVALAPERIALTDAQAKQIEERSGMKVRRPTVELRKGPAGELFFVDRVLGKHEEIVYALGVDGAGKIVGVEILEYYETYGGEIRKPEWRAQFVGKSAQNRLALGAGIDNISGATLSCRHVTDGIRRLLATRAVLVESESETRPPGNGAE